MSFLREISSMLLFQSHLVPAVSTPAAVLMYQLSPLAVWTIGNTVFDNSAQVNHPRAIYSLTMSSITIEHTTFKRFDKCGNVRV